MLFVIGLGGGGGIERVGGQGASWGVESVRWLSAAGCRHRGTCHPGLHWKANADGVRPSRGQVKGEEDV